eukprot:TRINITY_DN4297_c0_g1_i4.p1 TRINITY_DN4297_c0_g1~~TRINITY_DN4297_c0_g1_i4.p1  ORF type:complete len:396 (+),score=101.85 TRINITY_DN4297_c0_g1_i4:79-1188(+)
MSDIENIDEVESVEKPMVAWDDSDDETYGEPAKKRFAELNTFGTWSKNLKKQEEFGKSTKSWIKSSKFLSKKSLDIERFKDIASVKTVEVVKFHPTKNLLLSAGIDKTVHLYNVDGETNLELQSVFIQDMPIMCADYLACNNEVVLSGRRPFYYTLDLERGSYTRIYGGNSDLGEERSLEKFITSPSGAYLVFFGYDGHLIVLDGKSKKRIKNLKTNASVRAACFSADEQYLYATGVDGRVYCFDMRTEMCLYQHADEGSLSSTALTVSQCGRFYAVGSESGVVNVYNQQIQTEGVRTPMKSFMNLTTCVTNLSFTSDGNILCMSSWDEKDQLRMAHMPSLSIFPNWPTAGTPLKYVRSHDFSPNNGKS